MKNIQLVRYYKIALYAADLLEARELIKEMREDLLKISQYPIAFVCEEARIIAREAWKKSIWRYRMNDKTAIEKVDNLCILIEKMHIITMGMAYK